MSPWPCSVGLLDSPLFCLFRSDYFWRTLLAFLLVLEQMS